MYNSIYYVKKDGIRHWIQSGDLKTYKNLNDKNHAIVLFCAPYIVQNKVHLINVCSMGKNNNCNFQVLLLNSNRFTLL